MGARTTTWPTQGSRRNWPAARHEEASNPTIDGVFNEPAGSEFDGKPARAGTLKRRNIEAETAAKIRLLQLAQELGNVSEACRLAGFSRDSFYRYKRLFEAGGAVALAASARRRIARPTRISPEIERSILELVRTHPTYGRHMVSKMLHKQGIEISASSVRLIRLRHGLQTKCKRKETGEGSL
jgi:transposase